MRLGAECKGVSWASEAGSKQRRQAREPCSQGELRRAVIQIQSKAHLQCHSLEKKLSLCLGPGLDRRAQGVLNAERQDGLKGYPEVTKYTGEAGTQEVSDLGILMQPARPATGGPQSLLCKPHVYFSWA